MIIDYIAIFIAFFAVVDPFGTLPVFLAVTSQYDAKIKRKIALLSIITASAILLFFIVAGEIILTALAIPLSSFQIAGGIILFIFALDMVFGDSKPDQEIKEFELDHKETAIFPLAVPSCQSRGHACCSALDKKLHIYSTRAGYHRSNYVERIVSDLLTNVVSGSIGPCTGKKRC